MTENLTELNSVVKAEEILNMCEWNSSVFWFVTLCSMVEFYKGGACCLYL
jgi:hypothetical protein